MIIGDSTDGAVIAVRQRLKDLGSEVPFVDPIHKGSYEISLADDGSATVTVEGGPTVGIGPATRIWQRRSSWPSGSTVLDQPAGIRDFSARTLSALWGALFECQAIWMNRRLPYPGLETNKLMQAAVARDSGLDPIPTLFTNSPDSFRRFVESVDADVAIKSPVSWRAELDDAEETWIGTYTRRLSQPEALAAAQRVAGAALLVQPYIAKSYELRVTVVDAELFVCKIDSQASSRSRDDWRHYDLANVAHTAHSVPKQVRAGISRMMSALDLRFACLDMIVEPDGTHRFVEVNPSGQFGWIEQLTGLQISGSIVRWLIDPPTRRRSHVL